MSLLLLLGQSGGTVTAPTFTNLTGGGVSGATSGTTASVTPTANRLVLIAVHAYISTGSVQPSTPAVTGNGVTYDLVQAQDVDTSGVDRATLFVFRGMSASPTAGVITIDFGAVTMTRCQWAVDQSDANVDTSGTNGAGAIMQAAGVTLGAAGTSASVNFTTTMLPTDSAYSAWGHQVQEVKTPRAGWTELADVTTVTLASVETQYIAGTDTAGSSTWSTSSRAGGILVEIAQLPDPAAVDYRSSSAFPTPAGLDQSSASCAVPVPLGAQAGHVALLAVEIGAGNPAVTWPSGFTQKVSIQNTPDTTLKIAWKRLTGADTGTYTATWTGSQFNQGQCILLTGAVATGDPIEVTNTAIADFTTTVPSVAVTTATSVFLVHFGALLNFRVSTPPTSYTRVQDANYLDTSYRIAAGTGVQTASGGTVASATDHTVALLAILSAAGGGGITGMVAVPQASDTSTASGQLGYSGTVAATQAANTSTATGTVSAPVTGTAAASQASQTASAAGKLGYSGTAAATQAANTGAAVGKLGYSGTASTVQAGQTSSAAGQLGYTGTGSPVQAANTASASGTFTAPGAVSGTASPTQANQTSNAAGKLGYTGTAAAIQAGNTAAGTGTVTNPVTGTGAATQANQTASASGVLRYTGTVAVSQGSNTAVIQGVVFIPATGTVAVTQDDQTATASGAQLGAVVIRPNTGRTSRTAGGITPRPFTTITPRP